MDVPKIEQACRPEIRFDIEGQRPLKERFRLGEFILLSVGLRQTMQCLGDQRVVANQSPFANRQRALIKRPGFVVIALRGVELGQTAVQY